MNMGVAKRRRVDKNCAVNFRDKIIAWDKLPDWRAAIRARPAKNSSSPMAASTFCISAT